MNFSPMKKHEPILFAWGDVFGGGAQALIGVLYMIFMTDVVGLTPALAGTGFCFRKAGMRSPIR